MTPLPAGKRTVRLGFIASQFPRHDEAFLLRELVALSRGPWDLAIFSLRPCRDRVVHAQAKALLPRTRYAPFVWSAALWASHAWFLRRTPMAYLGALGWILTRHWNHPVILVKTLVFFPKTVHFARVALERGVSHLHAAWATYPAASALLISRLTGIPFSLSGHAHDLYTTNPTLMEKVRGARFVLTCTEENQRFLAAMMNGSHPSTQPNTLIAGDAGGEAPAGRPADQNAPRVVSNDRTESARRQDGRRGPAGGRTRFGGVGTVSRDAKIIVSHHGVDLARFVPAAKSPNGPCRLLIVGSLLPCKGLETLIEACRLLRDRGIAVTCTIAGGGPLEPKLRRLITRHGLGDCVTITGSVSQEVVVGLYQHAHLFVLPLISKIHWGIPNVLIEALATKTPVISCRLPSLRELIEHGRSGWMIPEGDPSALAQAVEVLWADAALRARLAEEGYRSVTEHFALERTGEALRHIFAEHMRNG